MLCQHIARPYKMLASAGIIALVTVMSSLEGGAIRMGSGRARPVLELFRTLFPAEMPQDSFQFYVLLPFKVLKRLQSKYGSLYRRDNVILSGTHTHSAPAGFFQYTLFILASEGFSNRTFQYLVSGIMKVGGECPGSCGLPFSGTLQDWFSVTQRNSLED